MKLDSCFRIRVLALTGLSLLGLPGEAGAQFLQDVSRAIAAQIQPASEAVARSSAEAIKQGAEADAAARQSATARTEQLKKEEADQKAQEALDAFRGIYLKAVGDFRINTEATLAQYRWTFTALVSAGIFFALASSILAFMKWSITAGICGLLTTTAITAPNIFSVRENVNFYTYIATQAYSLQMEANLSEHPNKSDADRWKSRLVKLAEAEESPVKDPNQLIRAIIQ